MDVTGRSEEEPAADTLARNLLAYVANWHPPQCREAIYAGDPLGKRHLDEVGLSTGGYDRTKLSANQVLILGPGSGKALTGGTAAVADWLNAGGKLLAIGLSADELNTILPIRVTTKQAEHISGFFGTFGLQSFAVGIGPADLHNRDPRQFNLISEGAEISGDGVMAQSKDGNIVFYQIVPWEFSDAQPNLKRTHRRATFTLSRLLANLGVAGSTPLLERFHDKVNPEGLKNGRWLAGLYIDKPEEWDDPYRHFRW
jgi:hypothetical protein